MSALFDPDSGSRVNSHRSNHGYVARLKQLPIACARVYGVVVFCEEDKRFYECQHIVTQTEDYYRWVAVTSGAQRIYFIPVERLTENEMPIAPEPNIRTNCFDAIASALNEIAIGLYRYNVNVRPLCYKPCYDETFIAGKKYYVWNNNYDRADYVQTQDSVPVVGKPYFIVEGNNARYATKLFSDGESFEEGVIYFESTRPIMIADVTYDPGKYIDHRVFEFDTLAYDQLTKKELVAKANEIIEVVNVTNAKISKATNSGTLYDLASIVNVLIDEVNPFSVPWNQALSRINALEEQVQLGSFKRPFELPVYVKWGNDIVAFNIEGDKVITVNQTTGEKHGVTFSPIS